MFSLAASEACVDAACFEEALQCSFSAPARRRVQFLCVLPAHSSERTRDSSWLYSAQLMARAACCLGRGMGLSLQGLTMNSSPSAS
eukprot:scaffold31939_cov61-Phaeocystis_antarctica.AAC.4